MNFSAVFPGQGSQTVGMFADFAATYPIIKQTFEEASSALGYDLWTITQHGSTEKLNLTEFTQPVMLTVGIAAWRVWLAAGGELPVSAAGHSLGEYSALVAAEALDLATAARLVSIRGQLMQNAVPEGIGGIAAVLGLAADQVISLCAEQAKGEVLQAVNFNSSNQIVIAGHLSAIQRGIEAAKAAGAKRALLLPVSVPVHSSLMDKAAAGFAEEIDAIELKTPKFPVIQNLEAKAYDSADQIKDALRKHVNSPVRWMQTIENMAAAGSQSLIEFGPGKVLTGLSKRIARDVPAFCVDADASLNATLEELKKS